MPYTEKSKEYWKERKQAQRMSKKDVQETVLSKNTMSKKLPPAWQHFIDYLRRPCPGMPALEREQRIAGSLGEHAEQVYFGLSGLTIKDVGNVIGTLPPFYPKE